MTYFNERTPTIQLLLSNQNGMLCELKGIMGVVEFIGCPRHSNVRGTMDDRQHEKNDHVWRYVNTSITQNSSTLLDPRT